MRLQELFETTEEDRALISLSSAIYNSAKQYGYHSDDYDGSDVDLGKIDQRFDTPIEILGDITILLQVNDAIEHRLKTEDPDIIRSSNSGPALGLWYANTQTIVLNKDYVQSNVMKGTITHELRHALDDLKSKFKAGTSKSYSTPRNPVFRNPKNLFHKARREYLARPEEINARFLEVLHSLTLSIRRAANMPSDKIRDKVMQDFKKSMETHHIAELFPEKEKSKDYQRLIKRAVDFIDKELAHKQDNQ